MKDFPIPPDDPRLTAYALGELEGDERAVVEAALRRDPALRAAVDEIRATTAQIESALAAEAAGPEPASTPPATRPIVLVTREERRPHAAAARTNGAHRPGKVRAKLLAFPQFYYVVGGLAAACFAVLVALHEPPPRAPAAAARTVTYREIALQPASSEPMAVTVPIPATPAAEIPRDNEKLADADIAVTQGTPASVPAPMLATAATEQAKSAPGTNTSTFAGDLTLIQQARAGEEPAQKAAAPEVRLTPPAGAPIAFNSGTPILSAGGGARPPAQTQFGPGLDGRNNSIASANQAVLRKSDSKASPAGKAGKNGGGGTAPTRMQGFSGYSGTAPATTGGTAVAGGAGGVPLGNPTPNDSDGVVTLQAFTVESIREGRAAGTVASANVQRVSSDFITPEVIERARANPVPGSRTDLFPGPRPVTPGYFPRPIEPPAPPASREPSNTEAYTLRKDNDFLGAVQNPFSTFSIDVDTASYTNVRRFLQNRQLPPADAIRIEELLNYFRYRYPGPKDNAPFAASMEVAEAPWAPTHRLVRIGLKAREVSTEARPAANLVFILDVSGSMSAANKLPLVQESMRLLVGRLRADDRVAIVTYSAKAELALPSTPVAQSREILAAIDALVAGGSTNGAKAIQLGYDVAKANATPGASSRLILCTDGDFNVGMTSHGELARFVEEKAKSGVFLTVLGFGMGNLKDATLEMLAEKGNGHYGYIDTRREAEKLLVEQVNSTLVTIAKDVKIQVEFNPARVASYRLIGYENRALKTEDFNNDKVDAGEIGAGHTVTALYEIVPVGVDDPATPVVAAVDERRYRAAVATPRTAKATAADSATLNELLTLKVRYKEPAADESKRLEFPLVDAGSRFINASADFKFASALAGFGMLLRNSPHKGTVTIGNVIEWAAAGAASTDDDPGGYRGEFIDLARRAQGILRGE